ncbi:MAG: CBS domain-containing protein [Candidatus Woesearchaeota archaeon]
MVTAKELLHTHFVTVDINDRVSSLIGRQSEAKETFAVVLDGKKYVGLVSKKWLLTARIDPEKMRIKNILERRHKAKTPFFVPKLSQKTELREIARLLVSADVRALPVIEKAKGVKGEPFERVIGIVRAKDVVKAMRDAYVKIPALDIASTNLVSIREDEEIGKALKLMGSRHVDRLIVLDKRGRLAGILSLFDLIENVHPKILSKLHIPGAASLGKWKVTGFGVGEKTSILNLPVSSISKTLPETTCCQAKTSVAEVIDNIVEKDVTSVVIVDKEQKPIGIVTVKDILQHYSR